MYTVWLQFNNPDKPAYKEFQESIGLLKPQTFEQAQEGAKLMIDYKPLFSTESLDAARTFCSRYCLKELQLNEKLEISDAFGKNEVASKHEVASMQEVASRNETSSKRRLFRKP